MEVIEPVPNEPAAIGFCSETRFLILADYHAGYEIAARYEDGIELTNRAKGRKHRLWRLYEQIDPDHLVLLGDVTHSIGKPGRIEFDEIQQLFEPITCPITVAKGNHDGILEDAIRGTLDITNEITVTKSTGKRFGPLGVLHGHTWPAPDLFEAEVICIGHEHPTVHLTDSVGGSRIEPVWVRGKLDLSVFPDAPSDQENSPELVIFPAFNDLLGGTWVNDTDQDFLSPFLPQALPEGTVYLLDGTQLGDYRSISLERNI